MHFKRGVEISKNIENDSFLYKYQIFLTAIHSKQGWTAITRHGVTRKGSSKKLKHTRNLFRKNLQLEGVG